MASRRDALARTFSWSGIFRSLKVALVIGTAEGWDVARQTVGADRSVEVSADGPDGSPERIVTLLRARGWIR